MFSDSFLTFAQNIGEAVLTSTHNICFGAKIRKICIPLGPPVLLYKSGVDGGIHFMDIFPDASAHFVIHVA